MVRKGYFIAVVALMFLFGPSVIVPAQSDNSIMWEAVNIERRDLYNGPGGVAMRPNLRRVQLIEKEKGGNNLKYRIRDASGRIWVAKIADESQPEVAAVRLLYGIGYKTEVNYIAPRLTIPRVGSFRNASLEARPEHIERQGRWSWDDNPFAARRELHGLKIMMALINNWDIKDGNNVILAHPGEQHFVISDLGSSFGKLPISSKFLLNRVGRNVNDPVDYANTDFVRGSDSGFIDFSYKGKAVGLFDEIPVEDGRWLAGLLSRLSAKQIDDAFRAANYTAAQRRILVAEVRNRIKSLAAL